MRRIMQYIFMLGVVLLFIYGFLPWLTEHVSVLEHMHQVLEWHEIDPSRFYYSDVPQTLEGEWYLRGAVHMRRDQPMARSRVEMSGRVMVPSTVVPKTAAEVMGPRVP